MLNSNHPYSQISLNEVIDNPRSKSNRGPAKHPVIAIAPYPHLDIAINAKRSPYEFPMAKTEIPKKLLLTPSMCP